MSIKANPSKQIKNLLYFKKKQRINIQKTMNVYPFGQAHGYDNLDYFEFPNLGAPLGKKLYSQVELFNYPRLKSMNA